MCWVCYYCSTSNDDANSVCLVCGAERRESESAAATAETRSHEESTETGSVVFSAFEVWKRERKAFFRRLSEIGKKRKKADPATERNPDRSSAPSSASDRSERRLGSSSEFAKPWPEHSIEFLEDNLRTKGYVRSKRTKENGVQGYTLYRADGSSNFIRMETALLLQLARRV